MDGESWIDYTLVKVCIQAGDIKDEGYGVGFKEIPEITKGLWWDMIIIAKAMGNEVQVIRMRKVLEDSPMVKNGDFQICMEVGMASFGLEKFKDYGSDFKGKIMNWLKGLDQGNWHEGLEWFAREIIRKNVGGSVNVLCLKIPSRKPLCPSE